MPKNTVLAIGLALGYGAGLALLLDTHLAPRLIASAYRGESWEPFNRALSGRSEHPLGFYLAKWEHMSQGLCVTLLAAAATTLAGRLAWGRSREAALLAILAPILAVAVFVVGPSRTGDYHAHMDMWDRILAGGDPWAIGSGNNYGPLFNLLAVPAAIHPIVPKVLFALVWAAVLSTLACQDRWIALAMFPLGVFQSVSKYGGEFDILVGACLLASIRDHRAGRDLACGTWLGVGFLLKFLPLIALPFLALDGRRLRWKLVLSAIAVSAGGLAISALVWGLGPTLRPLAYAAQRPSAWFSGFAFVRVALGADLDALSGPLIALSLIALATWHVYRRPDPVPTALAAIGLVLALYKHGGMQYPIVLAVPTAWFASVAHDRILKRATVLYAGWASALWVFFPTIWEIWSEGPYKELLKVVGGLPVFLFTSLLVVALIHRAGATTICKEMGANGDPDCRSLHETRLPGPYRL